MQLQLLSADGRRSVIIGDSSVLVPKEVPGEWTEGYELTVDSGDSS